MKKDKKPLLSQNLSELISKYGQTNVLNELEKEYLSLPLKTVLTNDIKDNSFLKRVYLRPEKIDNIAQNLLKNRIVEPLIVREHEGKYEVVSGRKRLAAAKLLQIEQTQVIVANYNDEEMLLILLAHARDEHNHDAVELSCVLSHLAREYRYKHETLARLSFLSRPQVTNILRLQKLPTNVLRLLSSGAITFGHARALINVKEEEMDALITTIQTQNLTVRELETLLKTPENSNILKKKKTVIQTKNKVTIIFASEEEATFFLTTIGDD